MTLTKHIEDVRAGIKAGRYGSEAAVSQGIVLRLLQALGWPTYDTQVVCPEFSLSGRRVDYGLCHPSNKPVAFIEVKQIGQSDGAERQLFEYAFHVGVPLAILTDGQEWNFFLPAEQGDYTERRVYKLDMVERDVAESVARLERYLSYAQVSSGAAIVAAREDYKNVSRSRQMLNTLPDAWSKLVAEEDELLLELIADKVEACAASSPMSTPSRASSERTLAFAPFSKRSRKARGDLRQYHRPRQRRPLHPLDKPVPFHLHLNREVSDIPSRQSSHHAGTEGMSWSLSSRHLRSETQRFWSVLLQGRNTEEQEDTWRAHLTNSIQAVRTSPESILSNFSQVGILEQTSAMHKSREPLKWHVKSQKSASAKNSLSMLASEV